MSAMLSKKLILIYFSFSVGILSAQTIQTGKASFYADKFDGRTTASGAIFRQNKMTAAHRKLPFGSKVRVTNLTNKKTVEVIINDRGPFTSGRVIDLSKSAARKLDFLKKGVVKVKIEVLSTSKRKKPKNLSQTNNKKKAVNKLKKNRKISEKTVSKNPNVDYYEVVTKRVSPVGFGIQVASYKEATNLIKNCDDIKNKTNKNVLVHISENNGQKIYIITIGSFSTREKANDFNRKINNTFEGSFVVAF